jgi:phosphohistidine phosphatase
MNEIALYLIRHATADAAGPAYPDDSLRPLTGKGFKQAAALARALQALDIRFDRLFSSPYVRARQTAEALEGEIEENEALCDDDYPALLETLRERLEPQNGQVALVGHEPYLGELASLLLADDPHTLRVRFKKAGMVTLFGPLKAGEMRLEGYLTYGVYKHLGSAGRGAGLRTLKE